jgi:nitrate reductase NapE component
MPRASRVYKISAILGLLVIILVLSFAWLRMNQFEQSVSMVFEKIVITNMEVNGLKDELTHIDKVLSLVDSADAMTTREEIIVDDIPYSKYEIERLRNEKQNILLHIKEKELDLGESSSVKNHVMNEVRLLFGVSLFFLVIGTLLAAFGFLAWYFKVEMFEDRRKSPRR